MELVALKKAARKAEPTPEKQAARKAPEPKVKAKAEAKPEVEREKPETKSAASSAKPKPHFLALARVQGRVSSEGQKLFITTSDGARLPISGFGPKQGTLIRMFAADVKNQDAVYSIWPASGGTYTICAFHDDPASFTPAEGTPDVDQMFISAKLSEIDGSSFCVKVGRNRKVRKGQTFKSDFCVSSSPAEGWEAGQWVTLECSRSAEQWRMISKT